ncbi:MAG: DegT/DnrJ/EryC1/StrS family aminotransferase [Acidobacteria bacterium]|nr:DegT/DnrJ/EryC1/StrS family aminotransferase [Acidobacteriota bacterium]MCI0724021.1 DegT/DnrJ/EryC1/StrS family aminotransferase [Acidobacteriota bacterium]
MIPRLKPRLGVSELAGALAIPTRRDIQRFESAFAASLGTRYALAFPYGRTAQLLLFETLGIRDKEIITPAYTCVVVQHASVCSGNRPVFVDSQESDFNMDLSRVPGMITEKTGAIIATSIFGYPCNLDLLDEIKKSARFDIPVIQDCAHSFGAEWKGRPVHKAGIAAYYGMNIGKMLTSIFGGMVTTEDSRLYEKLRALRDERLHPGSWLKSLRRLLYLLAIYPAFWEPVYTVVSWLERMGLLDAFTYPVERDFVIRMPKDHLEQITELEARIGSRNVERYPEILVRRREAAHYYLENLKIEDFKLPPRVEGATYSHFVVQVPDRREWHQRCQRKGLQVGQLIEYSVPEMDCYGAHSPRAFPVAARFARNTINLPVWGGVALARRVVERVKEAQRS